MTCISVRCPHCHSEQVVKRGKTHRGTQRYLCQNTACTKGSFLLDYRHRGCVPEVKHTIIDMSLNASGVRDTARVLHISTDTVLTELRKKEAALESVNTAFLRTLTPDDIAVDVERAGEAEMDEMWSFVGELVASFTERRRFSPWPRCRRQPHTRAVQSEKCGGLRGKA
jgi:transposase-like protein